MGVFVSDLTDNMWHGLFNDMAFGVVLLGLGVLFWSIGVLLDKFVFTDDWLRRKLEKAKASKLPRPPL